MRFLSENVVLWERTAHDTACPREIPFRIRIPKTFYDNVGESPILLEWGENS